MLLKPTQLVLAIGALLAGMSLNATADTTKSFEQKSRIVIKDLCADPEKEQCIELLDVYNIRENNSGFPVAPAQPYGSTITVPADAFAEGDKIKDINVTIKGLTHDLVDDVDMLLVGPQGQYVMLMSNVSGSTAAEGTSTAVKSLNLIFDDAATLPLPNNTRNDGTLTTSTTSELFGIVYDEWVNVWTNTSAQRFKPTDYDPSNPLSVDDLDQFRTPVQASLITPGTVVDMTTADQAKKKLTTSGPLLSSFNGLTPAGDWKLYIVDDFFWYKGEVKGWSLEITAGQ